jgi:site-specific DNA-methyltransferase (adenine-specific)
MTTNLICQKFENVDCERKDHTKIDLIIADPPDNIDLNYNEYSDSLPNGRYYELLSEWLDISRKLTNGPIFFTFNEQWTHQVEKIISDLNIKLVQRIYWYFTFGQNQKIKYTPSIRPIYWLNSDKFYPENIKIPSQRQLKYGDKRAKDGGKVPDSLWQFSRVCGTFKEKKKWHPTQLPMDLVKRIILGHSKEGDMVLDPFIGSGTTAYCCKDLNRNCIGIDCDPYYIEQITKELNKNDSPIAIN